MTRFIEYPKATEVESIFEKETSKKRKYDDYEIIEDRINGKLVVYLKAVKKRNKYDDAIICGYRNTSFLFGRRVQTISQEERKNIESKLRENNIRVLAFFDTNKSQ
jgi:hypothetical protein